MSASCLLVTLNCAKRAQPAAEIEALLAAALARAERPHFVALALQECASLVDAALGRIDEWLAPIVTAATTVADGVYTLVVQEHVGAVAVLVFSSGERSVQRVARRHTQFGKLWSSLKGAACVSLVLGPGERLTFVSAHLAANEGRRAARNLDFALLYRALGLGTLDGQLFVAGDLNYRATGPHFDSDELTAELLSGRAAWGLTEAPVEFPPSFKYRVGSSELNTARRPSWCDRVLFRAGPDVRVHAYDSVAACTTSDHKPVFLAIDTPTGLTAPDDVVVPDVRLPPAWLPRGVDAALGSTLFLGTTHTGWLALALIVSVFFFINSF